MKPSRRLALSLVFPTIAFVVAAAAFPARAEVVVDDAAYAPACGIAIRRDGEKLHIAWPMAEGEWGRLTLRLSPGQPLIAQLGVSRDAEEAFAPLIEDADPAVFLTVGSRDVPPGKPPEQVWQVFFDNPHRRPHQAFASQFELQNVRLASQHRRATVRLERLTVGSFEGALEFTFYADCRLLRVDAVVSTAEDRLAIFYDAGLLCAQPRWRQFAWRDTEGQMQRAPIRAAEAERRLAVRHRALVAESEAGALACFPPPHQFQFPRDYTDNLRFVWFGRGYQGLTDRYGFGIRQNKDGGGNFVPWFNAPPHTQQRMGVFYLLARGSADDALRETLRFTHGDRFPELPGYLTMTSHWHMAIAVAAMQRQGGRQDQPAYARLRADVPRDERQHGAFGRVSRRRASTRSRSVAVAGNGRHVRRVPPLV